MTFLLHTILILQVLLDAISVLDDWERRVKTHEISELHFLTKQTAEGLRVTLHSTIDWTKYLKSKYDIQQVFTIRLNQDALEVRYQSSFFQTFNRNMIFYSKYICN